jgi:hypothetical protein
MAAEPEDGGEVAPPEAAAAADPSPPAKEDPADQPSAGEGKAKEAEPPTSSGEGLSLNYEVRYLSTSFF